MTDANFATLPLLGEEEEEIMTAPVFKPTKGTGRKNKHTKHQAPEQKPAFVQAPASNDEPTPAVDTTIPAPTAPTPSADDGGIQSFLDAFSDVIEIVPDYANDAARLAASARTLLPLKPTTSAILVGAVAALAAYAAVRRGEQ